MAHNCSQRGSPASQTSPSRFAIAAGREVRVLVNPTSMTDLQTHDLARTIATNIEAQLRYPGEIKVHVIRETRVVSYAR